MGFTSGCCRTPWVPRCLSKQSSPEDLETDSRPHARRPDARPRHGPRERRCGRPWGPGFPKHPLHKIVCIGALVASRQPEGWRVDALGAPHTGERPEADLIKAFAERIGQLRPQMVTWNGHSFDLPVLRYRAMVNRVSAEGSPGEAILSPATPKTPSIFVTSSVRMCPE